MPVDPGRPSPSLGYPYWEASHSLCPAKHMARPAEVSSHLRGSRPRVAHLRLQQRNKAEG